MKTFFLTSLLAASAAAFAPAKQSSFSTQLKDYSGEIGVQEPLGLFDPLNLLKDGNLPRERFEKLRWLEIKHGRIAMLGVVGYLVTYAGIRFPGADDIPAGFATLDNLDGMIWAQMIATWTMMEAANQDQGKAPWGVGKDGPMGEFEGDFRNGLIDFGWDKQSEDWKLQKRTIELNQGRAAMMGILGLMVHDKLGNVDLLIPSLP